MTDSLGLTAPTTRELVTKELARLPKCSGGKIRFSFDVTIRKCKQLRGTTPGAVYLKKKNEEILYLYEACSDARFVGFRITVGCVLFLVPM